MKISKKHFAYLEKEITAVLQKYNNEGQLVEEYRTGKIPRFEAVKDIQRRFCFDVLYGAGLSKFVSDEIYPYANDEHLYTALKQICPKI